MKTLTFNNLLLVGTVMGAALYVCGCKDNGPAGNPPLRLGWQPPWANQGQIVEVFKHTDVLSKNGVRLEYKAFSYGGPMTEAALAGELDILFCGDQPAITLIGRDPDWRIPSRLVNYRSAFLVPPDSPAKNLKDLIGKKIATAFGSTTHRDAARIISEAGLEIGKDIELVNVDQAEHAALIGRGGIETWGQVAAIATYDPTIAVSLQRNLAKILQEWVSPGVIVVHKDIISERPDDVKNFLQSFIEAFAIYARDPERFDTLYQADSRLPLPTEVYRTMAAFEPNLKASEPSSVNILLSDDKQELLQRNADAALNIGIIKQKVNVQNYIDQRLAKEVLHAITKN